jgi:ABC-2 type transport system ATP-binding protein
VLEVLTDDPARAVEALRGAPGVIEAAMYGRAVHVMVPDEAAGLDAVPRRLAAAGRQVTAVRAIAPSLEDAFVALVRRQPRAEDG